MGRISAALFHDTDLSIPLIELPTGTQFKIDIRVDDGDAKLVIAFKTQNQDIDGDMSRFGALLSAIKLLR